MDPIADMFSQIKNAKKAGKHTLVVPFSKIKKAILEVLKERKYITDYREAKNPPKENTEEGAQPAKKKKQGVWLEISLNKDYFEIQRVSKPGRRIFCASKSIPRPKSPTGIIIVSTPEGLLVGEEARKKRLGGEVIAEVL